MIKNLTVDDQSFDQIVSDARRAIRQYAPDWTDENAHDPGITLIELFAYYKEMLQFYMDQPTDALTDQFLRLYGIERFYGRPARALVRVPDRFGTLVLSERMRFWQDDLCFEVPTACRIDPLVIDDILLVHNDKSHSVQALMDEGLKVEPFGSPAALGASMVLLLDGQIDPGRTHTLYVRVDEQIENRRNPLDPELPFCDLADLRWERMDAAGDWKPLEGLIDETHSFLYSGFIQITAPEEEGIYGLRVTLVRSDYDLPPKIAGIDTRVLQLVQTETMAPFTLSSNGLPHQRFLLPHKGIYYETVKLSTYDETNQTWKAWTRVDTLWASGPEDPHFAVDVEKNLLVFGDDAHGKIPPKGVDNIRVDTLERSALEEGNVVLGPLRDDQNTCELRPLLDAARGGMPLEGMEDRIERLMESMHTVVVAVSRSDYEEIVQRTPGLIVEEVKCLPLYRPGLIGYPENKAPNEVSLILRVVGLDRMNPSVRQNIKAYMDRHRLLTTKVHLIDPMRFDVRLHVQVRSMMPAEEAKRSIEEALKTSFVSTFGQPITRGAFHRIIASLAHVQQVGEIRIDAKQPLIKTKLGDLQLPPVGYGVLDTVEIVILEG